LSLHWDVQVSILMEITSLTVTQQSVYRHPVFIAAFITQQLHLFLSVWIQLIQLFPAFMHNSYDNTQLSGFVQYRKIDDKKLSCGCDRRSYCVRRTVYWQTIKTVMVAKVTKGWYALCDSRGIEFMNAPKQSVTTDLRDQTSVVHEISE